MDTKVNLAEKFALLRGVEHCPEGSAKVLLIEPDGTPNTGNAGGEMSADPIEV